MLARSLKLTLGGRTVGETPMLVPAFSSKVDPNIGLVIEGMEDYMTGPILVSAYDIFYRENNGIKLPIIFGQPIFLDSGGYECSKEVDLADIVYPDYKPKKWTVRSYRSVLDTWPNNRPTVIMSFDRRESMNKQIELTKTLFDGRTEVLTEMLLKPETRGQNRKVKVQSVIENLEALRAFDIIGLAEKELGSSLLERMENIAKIRLAMDERQIEKPLHIFGSLDAIATPLYFISGADIFDGLTWLRYAFIDGLAVYEQNYGVMTMPLDYSDQLIRVNKIVHNLAELGKLRQQMRNFLIDQRLEHFKYHRKLLEDGYNALRSKIMATGKEV